MKLEGKRVLVTGGAGFIGSHVVEELAQRNDVTVFDDLSVGRPDNLAAVSDRIELVVGDVCDADALARAMRGAQIVLHLAVVCLRTSLSDPVRCLMVNDLGTLNLMLAARSNEVERVVYVSSSEVYGTATADVMTERHPLRPETPYAASKLAGEMYAMSFCRTWGVPTTVVRPFNTYGPRSHLEGTSGELIPKLVARAMAGAPLLVFGDGLQTRDFTWVGDTARGISLAAASDELVGDCVNVARGKEVSILHIAERVRELLDVDVPIEHLPGRPGDVRRHHAAVEKAAEVLGFTAEVDFDEGLRRYIDWVRRLSGNPVAWLEREVPVSW